MAKLRLPYIALREQADLSIRPRFVPGVRERAMGFKGQDLKHDDGRWFSLDEARSFATAKQREIHAQRSTGRRMKSPPVARGRTLSDLWNAYSNSDEFLGNAKLGIRGLAPASQQSYRRWMKLLQVEPIWLAPVGSLDPIVLKALHGKIMNDRGVAMANYMMGVIRAMLSWGRLRGWSPKVGGQIAANPASRLDLPGMAPRIRVGTEAEIRALVEASDRLDVEGVKLSAIGDAVLTALFSGQRRKDILAFQPGELSNSRIELVQSKTKARVSIPMAPRLLERINAGRARRQRAGYRVVSANIVIHEGLGTAYEGSTFANHYQQVRAEAAKACPSVADFTFADLRDTAVTWYARAGCTVPEIASITGHSLNSIYTILKHYLALDGHLADNAVRKLVDYMEREGMAV